MEQSVTTLEDLLPLVRDAPTCREFGAVVIANVPAGQKKKLAMAARDALGQPWIDNTVAYWLSPSRHSAEHVERQREVARLAQAKVRSTPEGLEKTRAASRASCAKAASTPEGRERLRKASTASSAKVRATVEGREKSRSASQANAAKTRSTDEGRKRANASSCIASAKRRAEGKLAAYQNARYQDDPAFRFRKLASTRINAALRKAKRGLRKSAKTLDLLGCSAAEFMAHLEARFAEGMTWGNHGTAWHVDHVVPVAAFDLTTEEGQRAAFHFTNCQPLWVEDNLSKGSLHGGVRHRY